MSSPTSLAFYGIRFELATEEIEGLEARSDMRLVSARKHNLSHYWGNFGLAGDQWLLFIGAKLALLGEENQCQARLDKQLLLKLIDETEVKLRGAGFHETPMLHLQWQSDI